MTLKSQVAHGLKWQFINIVGRQLLSFVVFTTLARLLEPASFGLIGLVGVYLSFVTMFADQGIGAALIQRRELTREHLDTAFWFNVACALTLCLGTIGFAGPLAVLLGEPTLVPLLRCASLSLVITAVSTIHSTLFVKEMDFRRPVIRTLIANSAGGIVGVGMAVSGCGVWALIGQQLAVAIAGATFLWSVSDYRPAFRFSFKHLRELLEVSSSVFASSLVWFASSRLDQIIIGRFAGVPALGLYVVAGKLPELAKMVSNQPIAEVSLPALSKLQADHPRMCQAIYQGMQLNAAISFAVFVGIAAVAPDLVVLLFGAKWASAGSVCALLSIYTLCNTLAVFFHPALLASGGAGKYVLLNIWHAAGVLVVCLVGIRFGIEYLVLGLIINGLIVSVPALLFLRNRVGLSPLRYCQPCLAPCLCAILMFGATFAIGTLLPAQTPLILRLVCKIIIGATVYIGGMYMFARVFLTNLIETVTRAIRPARPAVTLVDKVCMEPAAK